MIRINEHYKKLQSSYLFSTISKKVAEFQKANPDKDIIRMGIGDVVMPLPDICIKALHKAVDELADAKSFRGYGPEQGYSFLREAIAKVDFQAHGADIHPDEVFVSDGAKCDNGNIQELFAGDITIAIPDPVYPVYVDTNVMAGRSPGFSNGKYLGFEYMPANEANGYVPALPTRPVDLIYLCFPNNPTGATITRKQLAEWVDYARKNKALILYDAAYVTFVRDSDLPLSIYEIEGAREVAIEFRSYSKTAGFTGTRCAYTIVPKNCMAYDSEGNAHSLHTMWNRRHTTKFNSVSYPIQRAAEAVHTEEGQRQIRALSDYYLANARMIRESVQGLGLHCVGGDNSPYIWVKTGRDSWEFFDTLLTKANVVCTPGSGFGSCGDGYIRISAFNTHENAKKAMERFAVAVRG